MNRTDLQQLADVRIAEAVALLSPPAPMPDGACYLAGYAVECALNVCVAKRVREHDFPDKQLTLDAYTHDFRTLVTAAGLNGPRVAEGVSNPIFESYWSTVEFWNERSRYERHSLAKAAPLIRAITDNQNGVPPWIRVRW